jgi:fatty-acyl-CoA synthase
MEKRMAAETGTPRMLALSVGETNVPLIEHAIGEAVAFAARRWPDNEALVSCHEGIRLTFAELDRQVSELAAGLRKLGLDRGDRVAVWAPTCAAWTLLQFATARADLVFVTFNTAYRRVELKHVLNLSGARAIVMAPGFKDIDYAAELAAIPTPGLEFRIWLGDTPPAGYLAFTDLPSSDLSWLDGVAPDASEPVNIQFTSGTTGRPKGVTLSHRNILNNGAAVGRRASVGANAAPIAMACRRCSSPCFRRWTSRTATSARCAAGSWRERPARSK